MSAVETGVGDVFSEVVDEAKAVFPIAGGRFKVRIKGREIAVYIMDQELSYIFADHRSKGDWEEVLVGTDYEMEAHLSALGCQLIAACL